MAIELATAYVSVVPSTKGIAGQLRDELGNPAEQEGKQSGSRFGAAMSGMATKALKVGAGAVVAGFGVSLVKGFGRLRAIDDARFKLQGLGHDTKTVDAIMKNALGAVKGTAFGLDEAATIAASAVAAGIKPGSELERTLSLTGDAATIAGVSLDEMGSIFNVVASKNRLSMMEVNRLGQRGIPIMQWLAEEYGVTAEAAAEMVSAGEVDFATFQKVIEDNIGGAALAAGESFSGAFANMGAALGRFGAVLLGPIFEAAKGWFGGITDGIDALGERVGPFADMLSGQLVAAVSAASDWFGRLGDWWASSGPAIIERVKTLGSALQDVLGGAFDFISGVWTSVLQPALSALRSAFTDTDGVMRSTLVVGFDLLVGALRVVGTVLSAAGGWMDRNRGATQALAAVVTTMFIPAMVRAGIAAVTSATQTVAASASKVLAFASERAAQAAHMAFAVRYYATIAAQAVASGARVVASWVAKAAAATANAAIIAGAWVLAHVTGAATAMASFAVSVATTVAGWVRMGVQSTIHGARMAAAWVLALGPVGWVIAAVVGLTALIVANWDKVSAWTGKAWSAVSSSVSNAWSRVTGAVRSGADRVVGFVGRMRDQVGAFFSAMRDRAVGAVTGLRDRVTGAFNAARSRVVGVATAIRDRVAGFFGAMRDRAVGAVTGLRTRTVNAFSSARDRAVSTVSALVSRVVAFFVSLPGRAASALSSLTSQLTGRARAAMQGFRRSVGDGWNNTAAFIRSIPGRIRNFFSNAGSWLVSAGRNILRGLARGIRNAAKAPVDAVRGVGRRIRNLLPGSPVKEGPLTVLNRGYAGKQITSMIGDGMAAQLGPLARQADAVARAALPDLTSPSVPSVSSMRVPSRPAPPTFPAATAAGSSGGRPIEVTVNSHDTARVAKDLDDVLGWTQRTTAGWGA